MQWGNQCCVDRKLCSSPQREPIRNDFQASTIQSVELTEVQIANESHTLALEVCNSVKARLGNSVNDSEMICPAFDPAECPRDRNRTVFRPFVVVVCSIRFSFETSETPRPDEVMPVWPPKRKLVKWVQRPPRATCGGESGAGAPAIRPQHVEVRVEERQLGEPCWRTRPRERREW